MTDTKPILYSFRRCPYAMRARLAIAVSGVETELREVVLRDKPPSMIAVSPKATVPVLLQSDGKVLEESIDLMHWALQQNDPQGWLAPWKENQEKVQVLIDINDGPFKRALDRYKYPSRYPDENIIREEQREICLNFLKDYDQQLAETGWLFGTSPSFADMALLPFVRQFAHVDKDWFDAQPIPNVQKWLAQFLTSPLFLSIMEKYPQWQEETEGVPFPNVA
jgi:glutathione S-transferase